MTRVLLQEEYERRLEKTQDDFFNRVQQVFPQIQEIAEDCGVPEERIDGHWDTFLFEMNEAIRQHFALDIDTEDM